MTKSKGANEGGCGARPGVWRTSREGVTRAVIVTNRRPRPPLLYSSALRTNLDRPRCHSLPASPSAKGHVARKGVPRGVSWRRERPSHSIPASQPTRHTPIASPQSP